MLVLVIISIILIGKVGDFQKKESDCISRGGSCYDKDQLDCDENGIACKCPGDYATQARYRCESTSSPGEWDPNAVCCISI